MSENPQPEAPQSPPATPARPPAPKGLPPGFQLPTIDFEEDRKGALRRLGLLRWGLVIAGILGIVLVSVLIKLGGRALDMTMGAFETQILSALDPQVLPAEREAFRRAFADFVTRAKGGRVSQEEMGRFREKTLDSLKDGRVMKEELTAITQQLENP
ncbi:MAG: hypothetical protein JNK60_12125 [Acidobacteria bacterium]|nr:hypothetical protein [Acidobacteriota bacterium]